MNDTLALVLQSLAPGQPFAPPASWSQGRTTYGGLSSALALHVAQQAFDALPPLKAAQVCFVGPVTQGACFVPELLRRGQSATQIGVDARVGDALALRASFIFGAARASQVRHQHAPCPDAPPPQACAPVPTDVLAPAHLRHFDVRLAGAGRPLSGAADPTLLAWVRLKAPEGVPPDIALLALGDCLPPAAMVCMTALAPVSSMNWTLDFVQPAQAAHGWFLLRSRSLAAADGYGFQLMEVWNRQRQPVLLGTQTVALFG